MKLMLAAVIIFSHSAFAVDTGDGSDGVCNVTGGADTQITAARKTYQCKTLNLDANLDEFDGAHAGAGGSALVIKVQGNVTVNAGVTIDLSGADGLAGDTSTSVKAGGNAGAGGGKGGNSPGAGVDGLSGSGPGAGAFGKYVTPFGTSSYGGGGGGASYKTQAAAQGIDGDDVGSGTSPNSGGANGAIYGSEAAFDSSFAGGSGGAAGGGGLDSGTAYSGSTGGGGGGALRIIAGGNITVNGSIISAGGNGGGTSSTGFAGGGGAGSGGAIWLQAGGALTVSASGSITTLGGVKGDNDLSISGGDGGDGRIRLDDSDGVITNAGTVSPTPYSTSFSPTAITTNTSAISRQYSSGVSCASVTLDDHEKSYNNVINLILGMGIVALAHFVLSKKSKV